MAPQLVHQPLTHVWHPVVRQDAARMRCCSSSSACQLDDRRRHDRLRIFRCSCRPPCGVGEVLGLRIPEVNQQRNHHQRNRRSIARTRADTHRCTDQLPTTSEGDACKDERMGSRLARASPLHTRGSQRRAREAGLWISRGCRAVGEVVWACADLRGARKEAATHEWYRAERARTRQQYGNSMEP